MQRKTPSRLWENWKFFSQTRGFFWRCGGVLLLLVIILTALHYRKNLLELDLDFWIQSGIFSVSAAAAIAVIYYNGKQMRMQALTNIIVRQRANERLQEAIRQITTWRMDKVPLTEFMDPNCEERKQIMQVLNHHEFIAVGIRLGAFDENTYKATQHGIVTRLWDDAEGFINGIRQMRKSNTPFQDLERIVLHWKRNPLKPLKKCRHSVQLAKTGADERRS